MAILFNFIPNHLFVDSGIAVCDAYCIYFQEKNMSSSSSNFYKNRPYLFDCLTIKCTLGQAMYSSLHHGTKQGHLGSYHCLTLVASIQMFI